MIKKNRIKVFLKRKTYSRNSRFIENMTILYNILKYPNMRMKTRSYGKKNADITFFVIRPRTDCVEGLMSLLLNVLKQISYAEKHQYVPIVDFENYKTQYQDSNKTNVWEYYFEQIVPYKLEEVYQSKNVILSGIVSLHESDPYISQVYDSVSINYIRNYMKKWIKISNEVSELINKEAKDICPEQCLGLYLRGTDYTQLQPTGHYIQPSVEMTFEKADEMIEKYKLKNVFLVTEDYDIYAKVKKYYKERLKIVSFDRFITNYSGKEYLSKDTSVMQLNDFPKKRGENYLCKILLLAKCACLLGGNTCGSWAANAFSEGYKEYFIYDLGRY